MRPADPAIAKNYSWTLFLRRFSKLTCFLTLFLIFVGGMVTSTGSGLSVPDWPLSYGMLFPPMVGGVFYEHGHRLTASVVGFFMLCLAIALARFEQRRWVRTLGFCALGAVIFQGILGGITVLFFLPTPVSVGHGILAQTFFILTILIAYSQSRERNSRQELSQGAVENFNVTFLRLSSLLFILVYCQLIVGAVMRHTASGLAIPDFPTIGGSWVPVFNDETLTRINTMRLDLDFQYNLDLEPVSLPQVIIHFFHRLMALTIGLLTVYLNVLARRENWNIRAKGTLFLLDFVLLLQITLGILTVLSLKSPVITSLHVVTGAALLGCTVLFLLRAGPLSWLEYKKVLFQ
jgi:heme a synthase